MDAPFNAIGGHVSAGTRKSHAGPGMVGALVQSHDLESHIEPLREFDKLRKRSAYLRDEGYKALKTFIEVKAPSGEAIYNLLKEHEVDIDDYVTAIGVYRRLARTSDDEAFVRQRLQKIERWATFSTITSKTYSIHLATELMDALVSEPELVLSRAVYLCWYMIIRELFTADSPDWSVGGARSALYEGEVNAYSTALCVRSMLCFADTLETTAKFFTAINAIKKQIDNLTESTIPPAWKNVDERRLTYASRNTLQVLSKGLALRLTLPAKNNSILPYVNDMLPRRIIRVIEAAETHIQQALTEIKSFRKREMLSDKHHCIRSESAHTIAIRAVMDMSFQLKKAKKQLKHNEWGKLSSLLDSGAMQVREALTPTRHYLLTVIDHQLGTANSRSNGNLDASELAWASAAYAAISGETRPESGRDHLLDDTVSCLNEHIADDGTFPVARPFHISRWNVSTSVSNTTTLGAFAELIRRGHYPLNEAASASKMLYHLEETRIKDPKDGKTLGWSSRHSAEPRKALLDRTAEAVETLATINRMYDEGINDIIFEHFSVKRPDDLKSATKVGLDELFYPDYGFALDELCKPRRVGTEAIGRESVAITLQKMRSHVAGLLDGEDGEKLHSIVLHGPAGTGKTMLVESLALTCNVPLVEVTPSDITKGGEEDIERQARTAFEALSLLTRVVILFDEFDPILKRRDSNIKTTPNIFSFLTPGMLPKLKTLSEKARARHVAYVLITNLIGTLDEAAVRDGRFNAKVGVYPPDPLSRYGRLAVVCQYAREIATNDQLPAEDDFKERLLRVVGITGGKGMTALTRDGWFRPRKKNRTYSSLPLGYLLNKRVKLMSVTWPEPEDSFNGIRGEGAAAEIEYVQWGWLNAWDNVCGEAEPDSVFLHKHKKVTNDELLEWPLSAESLQVRKNLRNDLQSKDQRLVTALLGDEILLRWLDPDGGLLAKLGSLMDCELCPESARRLCCTHVFSPEDLFIFKQCADRALVHDLFKDTGFVSHIIYVSILAKEFGDHKKTLEKYLETIPNAKDNIEEEWNALKAIYKKIDEEMVKLYAHIEKDYKSYIGSSEFVKRTRQGLNLLKVTKRWKQDLQDRKIKVTSRPAIALIPSAKKVVKKRPVKKGLVKHAIAKRTPVKKRPKLKSISRNH